MKYIGKSYSVAATTVTSVKTSVVAQTQCFAQDGTVAVAQIRVWNEE